MAQVRGFLCIAFFTALLLAGCEKPEDARQNADRFFQQVISGKTEEAYRDAGFAFQAEQSQRAFETAARDLGLIGASGAELKDAQVDDKAAKFTVEVTKKDGAKATFIVQLRKDGSHWRVHSLKTPRSVETGLVENRFSLIGRGASFTDSLNRPVPDQEMVQRLVQDTMVQFNESLLSGSFTDFYQNISRAWQTQLTENQLRHAFQAFIDSKVDLTEALKLDPVFDEQPKISADGLLVISGHYPWDPYKVAFQVKYMYELNHWKLFGIDVNLKK